MFEEFAKRVQKGVESSTDIELDVIDGTGPHEKMWNFAGPDGNNYRLTLTKLVPQASGAAPI